jgi:hypothetical protein
MADDHGEPPARPPHYAPPMGGEIFVWVMVGLFVLLIIFVILLGLFYPGTGADQLDWKPTRSPEMEAQNEIDDLAQMLEATNAKRRARGLEPLTEGTMEARVREDNALRSKMRGEDTIEEEMRQLREARDARKRMREERDQS